MSETASIVIGLILLLSPIGLILSAVFWRRAVSQRRAAEEAWANAEFKMTSRIDAIQAEATAEVERVKARFEGVTDLDAEKERVSAEIVEVKTQFDSLRSEYQEKKAIYDRLIGEISIFEDRLAFAEMGVYEPHFDFGDSEAYKIAITNCRDKQKRMISQKTAVFCTTRWTVDGSSSRGESMTNRNIRLTLRAFNNECDAAIANTRWNNVNAMEKRILRAHEQIEKLNASNAILIGPEFVRLKLEELYLTHEYREKQKAEREERVEAARLAREEQKLLRDMEEA